MEIDYRYNDPTTLVYEFGRWRQNRYITDLITTILSKITSLLFLASMARIKTIMLQLILLKRSIIHYLKNVRLIFHTAWEIVNREDRLALKEDIKF